MVVTVAGLAFSSTAGAALSQTNDPSWVPDNRVAAIVQVGSRIYLGGDFTKIGRGASNGAAFDTTNGQAHSFPNRAYVIWRTGLREGIGAEPG